jgi:hypothetical protein
LFWTDSKKSLKAFLLWLSFGCFLEACMESPIDAKLKLHNASKKPFLVLYTVDNPNVQRVNGLSSFNPFHDIQQADTTRGYQADLLNDDSHYLAPGQVLAAYTNGGRWEDTIGKGKPKGVSIQA